jgi:hypothetical protein
MARSTRFATYAPHGRPAQARSAAQALSDSTVLSGLLAGHRRAQACFVAVQSLLPGALRGQVRAGPIDAGIWTLFASHASAAAKLRQVLPTLLAAVATREPDITEIRVKIRPPEPG